VLSWLVEYALALALWFVFAGKLEWHELLVGGVAAAIAATASHLVLGEHIALFTAKPKWLVQAIRIPGSVVADTWLITKILIRPLFGGEPAESRLSCAPFDGGGDDPESATRRALAIAYTTISPAVIVLGFDRERGLVVYHELAQGKVPEVTRRLGERT
jgi:hypothetical protein